MACGTFTETKVPKSNLAHRVSMWNVSGATHVTWQEDDDLTYTITAVFPPCPDNTSHSTESKSP
jgi:hypothetical protein